VEVEAIGHVRHKNLVRLLGYCVEGIHRYFILIGHSFSYFFFIVVRILGPVVMLYDITEVFSNDVHASREAA
jgi:hypothetical protein